MIHVHLSKLTNSEDETVTQPTEWYWKGGWIILSSSRYLQSLLCWLYGRVLSCKMFNDSGMVINNSSKKERLMVRNIDSLTFYLMKKVLLYEISSVARRCVNYGFCLITLHLKALILLWSWSYLIKLYMDDKQIVFTINSDKVEIKLWCIIIDNFCNLRQFVVSLKLHTYISNIYQKPSQ